MAEILRALDAVLRRADMFNSHHVEREKLSTRERMSAILVRLQQGGFIRFESLFLPDEGRLGVVVSFLAMLELVKEQLVEWVQTDPLGPIHLRARVAV